MALEWVPDGRLFAVGGLGDNFRPLATVEMLECPWFTEEPVHTKWQYVSPMQKARCAHAVAFFTGKIIAAGGHEEGSVECFTLPTSELPQGQWVNIRPMSGVNTLAAILPFGEDLLFVGKPNIVCFIGMILQVVISWLLMNPSTSHARAPFDINKQTPIRLPVLIVIVFILMFMLAH